MDLRSTEGSIWDGLGKACLVAVGHTERDSVMSFRAAL
jgi:hypothetical protein